MKCEFREVFKLALLFWGLSIHFANFRTDFKTVPIDFCLENIPVVNSFNIN